MGNRENIHTSKKVNVGTGNRKINVWTSNRNRGKCSNRQTKHLKKDICCYRNGNNSFIHWNHCISQSNFQNSPGVYRGVSQYLWSTQIRSVRTKQPTGASNDVIKINILLKCCCVWNNMHSYSLDLQTPKFIQIHLISSVVWV